MLRTQRHSMLIIFIAFVFFGVTWLFFHGLNDPSSEWDPIVRLHPEVGAIFSVFSTAGEVAFLMILVSGLPIIFTALKRALATKRRDVLTLFGAAAFMIVVLAVAITLIINRLWNGGYNGGVFGLLALATLVVVTVSVSVAVARSEFSAPVLRFALAPAAMVTVAMGVALVAAIVEIFLLSKDAPQLVNGVNYWIPVMAISTGFAGVALWRGLRARTPKPA